MISTYISMRRLKTMYYIICVGLQQCMWERKILIRISFRSYMYTRVHLTEVMFKSIKLHELKYSKHYLLLQFYSRRPVNFLQALWNFEILNFCIWYLFFGKLGYVSLVVWWVRTPDSHSEAQVRSHIWAHPF